MHITGPEKTSHQYIGKINGKTYVVPHGKMDIYSDYYYKAHPDHVVTSREHIAQHNKQLSSHEIDAIHKHMQTVHKKHMEESEQTKLGDDLISVINEDQLDEEKKKKIKVSVTKPIGYKIADIGPGGKEHNVKRVGPGSKELEESTLSVDEKKKKEEIVKAMKKDKVGFVERYGKRAKEVMYATATKKAKELKEDAGSTSLGIIKELIHEAAFTRRHFRQVADIIKNHPDPKKRQELASHHAEIFSKSNPRFDHKRFFAAAGAEHKVNEEVEQIEEAKKENPFKVGDKVKLGPTGHVVTGGSREADSFRKHLSDLKGHVGTVSRVFPGSKHTNVDFHSGTVGLDHDKLELHKEEVEQIDEISKGTLKRYIHAASHDAARAGLAAGHDSANQHHAERKGHDIIAGAHGKSKAANIKKVLKRTSGILRATNRLEEAKLHVPLKGHDYHHKSDAELHYIAKDAKEAMDAIGTHDRKAANKYADQVNDAVSILAYRRKGGKQVVKPSNKIQEAFNVAFNEGDKFKVGDVVVPDKGPHAGQPHDVIHIHGNGKINVRPTGMHHSKNKYRLGAASADPSELRHHLDLKEEMQTGINRKVVQEAFKSAKEKKKVEKSKPKGEKIEVKGPGPDDKFQKDPIITPLTTSYTKG